MDTLHAVLSREAGIDWNAISSIVLMIYTLITLGLFYQNGRTLKLTERSLQLTEKSLQLAERTFSLNSRPFVTIDVARSEFGFRVLSDGSPQTKDNSYPYRLIVDLKNVGNSPSKGVSVSLNIDERVIGKHEKLALFPQVTHTLRFELPYQDHALEVAYRGHTAKINFDIAYCGVGENLYSTRLSYQFPNTGVMLSMEECDWT